MSGIRMHVAGTIVVAGVALALAASAAAQDTKPAGVVTSLQGPAKLQRLSTPIQELRFRDEVRVQDRITTGDQALARILMGGKAVVTVREHSSLTITDTQGTATIDITAGKIALAVAKERMAPGERIEIKTPNAVAGVRGTVVIAEVGQLTAQAGGTVPGSTTTRFTLLTGIVDVTLLDPSTGRPGSTRFTMNPLQTLSLTGFTPPQGGPRSITRAQGQAAANDYKVGLKDAPQGGNAQISDRQVEQASNAAAAGAGGSGGTPGSGQTIINTTNNTTTKSDPKSALCTSNCVTPPSTMQPLIVPINNGTGGNSECRGSCPSEGLRARRR